MSLYVFTGFPALKVDPLLKALYSTSGPIAYIVACIGDNFIEAANLDITALNATSLTLVSRII